MISRSRIVTLALAAALGLLLGSAETLMGQSGEAQQSPPVIPAKAGTQCGSAEEPGQAPPVIPANAGSQCGSAEELAGAGGMFPWAPASAGVTTWGAESPPLAARDLDRGETLTAADMCGDGSALIGWVTQRVITTGQPLRKPAVAPPLVVRSGEDVQLVWTDGSLVLRMSGRAMNSAAAGERVTVRVDTQRRFQGIAHATGEVRLASPTTMQQ